MPYDYDPNLDDESSQSQNQSQGQTQDQGNTQLAGGGSITGGASQTTGAAGAPSSGASGSTAPSAAPAPTHPSNYQNLNAYLDANSGSGFGQQFVGDVNNDVNAAGAAQTQGANLFKGASDAGTVNQNQSVIDSTLADPYATSQDPSQTQAFQAQVNAKYNGPQSYSDDQAAYQTAYGATQKAEDTAQAAQTEGGRFALLNNYFGTPTYNQGQQSLDNLLVQADPTTAQGIQQARQNADQSLVSFQNQAAPLQQYAAQNNATTQATAQNAQTAANNAISGMQTDYAGDLTNAQNSYANAWTGLQSALANGEGSYQSALAPYGGPAAGAGITDPYYAATGQAQPINVLHDPRATISVGGQGPVVAGGGAASSTPSTPANSAVNPYWGVNAGSFVSQAGGTPDASNVLSLAQQQKLDALQGLMGGVQTPFNASEAGGYDPKTNGISFDSTGFNQAEQTAQNNYTQAQTGILGNIQSLVGQPVRGSLTGNNPAGMAPGLYNQVQAQYDQLNKIRAGYGLGAVSNPYTLQGTQTGGTPVRGAL